MLLRRLLPPCVTIGAVLATLLAVPHTATAADTAAVSFVSPTTNTLAGTVDIEVDAPPTTTAVRFSMDGTAFAEVTDRYAKSQDATPIWRTATDAAWFPAGTHTLLAEAVTPTGTVTATKSVTTVRPADPAGVTTLNGAWRFAADNELSSGALDGSAPPAVQPGFDETPTTAVLVPATYGTVRDKWNGETGHRALYRKQVDLGTKGGQRVQFVFDSCYFACDYYLNGSKVGSSKAGMLPQRVDATAAAHDGANTLAVIVDNRQATIAAFTTPALYWQYGGLLRDVRLERTDAAAITGATAEGNPADGKLTIRAQGTNTGASPATVTVGLRLQAPGSTTALIDTTADLTVPAGGGDTAPATLTVPSPQLWSPADPELYTLTVTPPAGRGRPTTLHPAFRTVAVSGSDVTINGKVLSGLRGYNRHVDYPGLGRTEPDGLAVRELREFHTKGFRIMRPGHYAPTPALLDEADRLGMLVVDEIPVQQMTGTALATAPVQAFAKDQLKRMIDRDRGHPSVIIWSVGNENNTTNDNGAAYVKAMTDYGRSLDPKRLYTEANNKFTSSKAYGYEDIVLPNIYYGWYGSHDASEIAAGLDSIQQAAAGKPLLISEYGAEAVKDRDGTVRGTEYYQASVIDDYNRLAGTRPHTLGMMVWSAADFLVSSDWTGSNPEPAPPYNAKGLRTWFREPKLAWKVVLSPVRIRTLAPLTVPAAQQTSLTVPVTIDDVTGRGASGTLQVTPPSGFTTSQSQPFTVAPGGSTVLQVTLDGRMLADGTQATPGLVRAVIDADTEAMPRPLNLTPGGTALALDAGTDTSSVASGYQALKPTTAYSTATGFGWTGGAPQSRDRIGPDPLRADFATDTVKRTLRVNVPAGNHTLYVLVGDDQYAADPQTVAVNGTTVITTQRLATGTFRWYAAPISAGTADIAFTPGAAGTYWKASAVIIQ
ncbi:glycoside hydrolase family 2 TIM barrel-domain containing protein [Kitasatospora purpeofusca]|uniref:glycoside hydrolase family 2 protein n=1 Tax=Kitasatospora purpeofusca TaxID=67352 RepID=UPI0030F22462